jgi:hypothetical protein
MSVHRSTFEVFSQTANKEHNDWFCSFFTVNTMNREILGLLPQRVSCKEQSLHSCNRHNELAEISMINFTAIYFIQGEKKKDRKFKKFT